MTNSASAAPDIASLITLPPKWGKDGGLSQIYSSGIEFAWLNKEGKQLHSFAFCRDYLQDVIQANHNKSKFTVYGMSYDANSDPNFDFDMVRMAVRLAADNLMELMQNSLRLLHNIEAERGFAPSKLIELGKVGKHNICLFLSDVRWIHASPLLSLYTTSIRVGAEYTTDEHWEEFFTRWSTGGKQSVVGGNDTGYLRISKSALPLLVRLPLEELFAAKASDNYPTAVPPISIHNRTGICAYASGEFPKEMPWPKPAELLKKKEG